MCTRLLISYLSCNVKPKVKCLTSRCQECQVPVWRVIAGEHSNVVAEQSTRSYSRTSRPSVSSDNDDTIENVPPVCRHREKKNWARGTTGIMPARRDTFPQLARSLALLYASNTTHRRREDRREGQRNQREEDTRMEGVARGGETEEKEKGRGGGRGEEKSARERDAETDARDATKLRFTPDVHFALAAPGGRTSPPISSLTHTYRDDRHSPRRRWARCPS